MNRDGVVLLHGIFRTHRSMQGLTRFLEAHGYRALNISYPSTRLPIEEIADYLHSSITEFSKGIQGDLHWVGYSMGGLAIRAYLHRYACENMGRVVMLGTPNHGSEVADFLQNRWFYKKLYGPAGKQLVTGLKTPAQLWGEITYELGIIAGNRSLDPFSSYLIAKPNDGKVSIESTRVVGMKDHIIIPVTHTFFPANKKVWQQTLHFLQYGNFLH